MLRRELSLVLRARLTWVQAALSAILVGHGFVLAVDLYAAGSRSVSANLLMAREFDPLAGIVRPTLGGLYLAVSLLGPLAAVRPIAVEKERRTFHALVLQVGSPIRLLLAKWIAAILAVAVQLVAPLILVGIWLTLGGHLAFGETLVALLGHVLYLILVASLATAAAAWTATVAQAATATLVLIAASWAIDASEGFAALAWLGRALDWSVTTQLLALERGTLSARACLMLLVLAAGALAVAWLGVRSDFSRRRRALALVAVAVSVVAAGVAAQRVRWAMDTTESRRGSLPEVMVAALRTIDAPISVEVHLDRDDARRRQLESDTLAKLRLARPDVEIDTPLDDRPAPVEGEREEGYGRIVVRVGDRARETFSTSRKELITLVLEAAALPAPEWSSQSSYRGYPLVVEGVRRRMMLLWAYLLIPLALASIARLKMRRQ